MRVHLTNLFKYLFVGGTAAVVDLGIFWIFAVVLEWHYLAIGAAGFIIATAVNYQLCIRFIYQRATRFNQSTEIASIYLASGIGLTLHELILYAAHQHLLMPLMIAKIMATGLVFVWNFSIRNFYVFAPSRKSHFNQTH